MISLASQTFTSLGLRSPGRLPLVEAKRLPSGLKIKVRAAFSLKVRISSPVSRSQIRNVPSPALLAKRLLSELKAILQIQEVCPWKVKITWQLWASHTLIRGLLSFASAVATRFPSGLSVTNLN